MGETYQFAIDTLEGQAPAAAFLLHRRGLLYRSICQECRKSAFPGNRLWHFLVGGRFSFLRAHGDVCFAGPTLYVVDTSKAQQTD